MDEKRAELAAQRKLLDEYIQQQQKGPALVPAAVTENNHSNGFVTVGDPAAAATLSPTEMELKLRGAIAWAEECESKLANQEAYWADQKLRWQRERSDLQDRIREIVLERASCTSLFLQFCGFLLTRICASNELAGIDTYY